MDSLQLKILTYPLIIKLFKNMTDPCTLTTQITFPQDSTKTSKSNKDRHLNY